ncbi:MAG: ABC transporter ATP-binding protein [Bacillota bacterium]
MELEKNETVVEVRGLTKKYGRTVALDQAEVSFPQGQLTALIGPNGSGKSTLLQILAGLTYPDSGSVRLLNRKPGRSTKDEVAFLPEIDYLYNWMKVEQTIRLFASQYQNFSRDKAYDLLENMNLQPDIKISSLSKGMRGRLKLVLAMAREVDLYIMDEPLSGLDPHSKSYILETLNDEFASGEKTVILSTHEVIEAERFFDYVIMLENGQVKKEGFADDLRAEYNMSLQELAREVFA